MNRQLPWSILSLKMTLILWTTEIEKKTLTNTDATASTFYESRGKFIEHSVDQIFTQFLNDEIFDFTPTVICFGCLRSFQAWISGLIIVLNVCIGLCLPFQAFIYKLCRFWRCYIFFLRLKHLKRHLERTLNRMLCARWIAKLKWNKWERFVHWIKRLHTSIWNTASIHIYIVNIWNLRRQSFPVEKPITQRILSVYSRKMKSNAKIWHQLLTPRTLKTEMKTVRTSQFTANITWCCFGCYLCSHNSMDKTRFFVRHQKIFHQPSKYVKRFAVAVYGHQSEKNWNYCLSLFCEPMWFLVFNCQKWCLFWMFDEVKFDFHRWICVQLFF